MGPHIHNNPEICLTLANNGALEQVETEQEMADLIDSWLNAQEQRKKIGENGLATLEQNAGIINQIVEHIQVLCVSHNKQ
jgi:3-deoxy-D-manno-octulosonic-acid transferase